MARFHELPDLALACASTLHPAPVDSEQLGLRDFVTIPISSDIDPADPSRGWVGGVYWITDQWHGRQPAMWINSVPILDPATLFADGFESGDAGARSGAVPWADPPARGSRRRAAPVA